MIERFIFLGFGLLVSCKDSNSGNNYAPDSFEDMKIVYTTGDEVMQTYAMMIYDSAGIVKAKFTSPISDKRFSKRQAAVRILNQEDLQMVFDFIERAKRQNDTCSLLSTSLDRYRIKIGVMDSISIYGNCSWGGLDYAALTQRIFNK